MADSSPLVSRLVGALGDDVTGRLGDVLEAPRELEGLVEQLLAGDIDALLFDDAATLERAGRAALDQKKASGEALLVARGVSGSAAAEALPVRVWLIACPCVPVMARLSRRCSAAITWSMTCLVRWRHQSLTV